VSRGETAESEGLIRMHICFFSLEHATARACRAMMHAAAMMERARDRRGMYREKKDDSCVSVIARANDSRVRQNIADVERRVYSYSITERERDPVCSSQCGNRRIEKHEHVIVTGTMFCILNTDCFLGP